MAKEKRDGEDIVKKIRILLQRRNTPSDVKRNLLWELKLLVDEHPEFFVEDRTNAIWNEFSQRLLISLLSEFSKTDKYKNLQKDIAMPLLSWLQTIREFAPNYASSPNQYTNFLFNLASNLKLELLLKIKKDIKNQKFLRDYVILNNYKWTLKKVRSICRKKYRNTNAKFLDLRDALKDTFKDLKYFEKILRKVVSKKPSAITYELLASRYKMHPTTVHDIVMKTRKAGELERIVLTTPEKTVKPS